MRLLVYSDSHGQLLQLKKITDLHPEADAIFHLGDGAADFKTVHETIKDKDAYGHKGNCDSSECGFPAESVQEINGVRIFACHGHTRHVKSGLIDLMFAAMEQNAKVCLYGHTHIPDVSIQNGIWFINPGAALTGRYALLDIGEDGAVYPSLQLL